MRALRRQHEEGVGGTRTDQRHAPEVRRTSERSRYHRIAPIYDHAVSCIARNAAVDFGGEVSARRTILRHEGIEAAVSVQCAPTEVRIVIGVPGHHYVVAAIRSNSKAFRIPIGVE